MLVKDRLKQEELYVDNPRSGYSGLDSIKVKYLSYNITLMSHIDDFYGDFREMVTGILFIPHRGIYTISDTDYLIRVCDEDAVLS